MRKAMADLAAHVSINTVDARANINLLKRNIRELTRSWQGDYHAMIAAGRGDEALQRKASGLKDVQHQLKETIDKVRTALNNSSNSKGTQKYRRTYLDLQSLESKYAKVGAQVKHNDEVLTLHNEKLRNTAQQERSNNDIERSRIQTMRDAGHETEADTEQTKSYAEQLRLLQHRESALADTIDEAKQHHLDSDTNPDYTRLVAQLNQVKDAYVRVSNEQRDFNDGLTTGKEYDELYNQSTNKVIASLRSLKGNAEAGRVEYQRLTHNIGNESKALELEKEKARSIRDQSGEQSIAFARENSKLQSLNNTFKYHAARIHSLGASYGTMSNLVAAHTDHMTNHIDRLNHVSHSWLQTAHSLAGASFALGSAFLYGEKQSMGLQNQFNYVKNLLNTSGESYRQADGEVKQMGRDTAQMSVEYGKSQQTIANGYTALVKRGYTGQQALASQKTYLQGAIASGDKYNDVMDTAASTLEAFGMRSNNNRKMMEHTKIAVNQLAYAADKTATDFSGIGYGMKFTGATAHSANQSLSETSSALGVLSNNGQNATNAGFGLRKVLNSFIGMKDTKAWKKILPQLGLSPKDFQDAQGHFKSLSTMMNLLETHTRKLTDAQRTDVFHQLFGATGQESALILAKNTGNLASLNREVAKSQNQDHGKGYAARIAAKNMKSTQNQINRLKEAGNALAVDYANGLNPEFTVLAKSASTLVEKLQHIPRVWKDIAAVSLTVIPIMSGIAFAGAAIAKTFAIWHKGIKGVGTGLEWLKGHITGATNVQKQMKKSTDDNTESDKQNNDATKDLDNGIQHKTTDTENGTKADKQSTDQENLHSKSVGVDDKATQQASKNLKDNTKNVNDNSKSEKSASKLKQDNTKVTQENVKSTNNDSKSNQNNAESNQSDAESTTENSNAKANNVSDENKDSNATGSNTSSVEKNTNAQRTNATAINGATGALKTHTSAENADGSADGSGASDLEKDAEKEAGPQSWKDIIMNGRGKSGLMAGGLMAGQDIISGDNRDALNDGVGTAAGEYTLGPIGALLGPSMLKGVENDTPIGGNHGFLGRDWIKEHAPKPTHKIDLSPKADEHRLDNMWKHMKHGISDFTKAGKKYGDTDEDIARGMSRQQAKLAREYARANRATNKQMEKSTNGFVRAEEHDAKRAERNYLAHRGRMSKAQRGYFRDMYRRAANYEKQRGKDQRAHLKQLYKDGKLTKKEYQREDKLSRKHEAEKLKRLNRDYKRLDKDSDKHLKTRRKALDRFNKDISKDTAKNNKKQLKLRRYLDRHVGRLDAKAYAKVIKASNRAYRRTVGNAGREYRAKVRYAHRGYRATLAHARRVYGVHSSAYRRIEARARRHEHSIVDSARSQRDRTVAHAKSQAKGVISAANKEKDSSVRAASKEKGAWSRSAGYISSHPIKIKHITIYKTIHKHAGGTLDTQALHLAIGNLPGISHDENAVINDGSGRELVKLPNGQLVLPSGRNIHTVLPKGTSVFDAIDTRKLLALFNTMSGTPKHYASGSSDTTGYAGMAFGNSDNSDGSSNSIGNLSDTAHKTKKSMDKIHDVIDNGYQEAVNDANGQLSDFDTNSDQSWEDIAEKTKQHIKDIHHDTSSRFEDMLDILDKSQAHSNSKTYHHLDTTVRYFRSHFGMISPITGKSMKHGTSIINAGIRAIDRVLKQFGGNSHVLHEIHFATGTSTPMMEKQLAILNDATSGPVQEAVVSQSGKVRMPKGRNAVTALNPGDTVLNGSDTQYAIKHGLIPHYKFGLKSALGLFKLFKNFNRSPTHFAESNVNRMTRLIGDQFTKGAEMMVRKGTMKPAIRWSKALWSFIHNLINPQQSSSKFLNYAEKMYSGIPYVYGAMSRHAMDCSGMIVAAAQHFGIPLPHQSDAIAASPQTEYMGKSNPQPGWLAIFGHGGMTGHIGIATGHNGMMFDETPPRAAVTPLDCGDPLDGYYKLRNLHDDSINHSKKNPLYPLIRREIGAKAIKWIKLLAPFLAMGGDTNDNSLNIPGGKGLWTTKGSQAYNEAKATFEAARQLGFDPIHAAAITGNGGHESAGFTGGLRRPQIGGGGGQGIFQFTGQSSHYGWTPLDQVKSIIHNSDLDPGATHWGREKGSLDSLTYDFERIFERGEADESSRNQFAHTAYDMFHKGYANGGLSISDKLAHISEDNNPEMVLPLTDRSRAVELMLKSLQYMFGNDLGNRQTTNNKTIYQNQAESKDQQLQDRRFEQQLIQSNQNKDKLIKNILNKMTVLIQTIRTKPVLSNGQIYHANRSVAMKKIHLRNLNRGNF